MPHPPLPADESDPDGTEETDEYEGPPVPEPPRRVPFGVTVVAALLGVVSLLVLFLTVDALTSFNATDGVGRAAAGGLLVTLLAICSAFPAAVAWSFVRNGNQIGSLVVGGLVALAGLISLAIGMLSDTRRDAVVTGLLGVVLGLLIALLPLLGDGPGYLAARRVWAKAERDWLRELTTAPVPPVAAWPGAHPGRQWPGPQAVAWPQQQMGMPPQQWAQGPQQWAQGPQWGPGQQWGPTPGPWQMPQGGPPGQPWAAAPPTPAPTPPATAPPATAQPAAAPPTTAPPTTAQAPAAQPTTAPPTAAQAPAAKAAEDSEPSTGGQTPPTEARPAPPPPPAPPAP